MIKIPFNKPFIAGNEIEYIKEAVSSGKISGDGIFSKKCQQFFEKNYGFKKTLLTTSCTDALEMASLLCEINPGDEVILPSYTFVSTANAFALRGAKLVFADSMENIPNINPAELEKLISPATKAVVTVHYGGIACMMDEIMAIAKKNNVYIIEDAAQAVDSFYKGKPLGSIGELGAFSFHETKNIICGEGGMIAVNRDDLIKRAEIIREKGTNRAAFFRAEVEEYNWVDIGSSFLPSEILAAYLWGQLEHLAEIQEKRLLLWNTFYERLKPLNDKGFIKLPVIPDYATNNAHIFYFLTRDLEERQKLAEYLKDNGVIAVFHYLSLHRSPYYSKKHGKRKLPNADKYSDTLLRLPLFFEMNLDMVEIVVSLIEKFYGKK
ncbi:MAG: dTDP-4-amino-4,6-dideoxygalactose transaminase [Ignavibacteriales bacterium]|nr:dTDP-4-amino-4,6-dideoxygalactose transaminase [Ignavibacteriales bacterium]